MDKKTTEEAQAENVADFIENGPGLRYGRNTWIVARDPKRGVILIGGLGGMGIGEMWFAENESHRDEIGYSEAKIIDTGTKRLFGID